MNWKEQILTVKLFEILIVKPPVEIWFAQGEAVITFWSNKFGILRQHGNFGERHL